MVFASGCKISIEKSPMPPEYPGLVTEVNTTVHVVSAGISTSISLKVTRFAESRAHSKRGRSSDVHGGGPRRLRIVGNWIVTLDSAGIMLEDANFKV